MAPAVATGLPAVLLELPAAAADDGDTAPALPLGEAGAPVVVASEDGDIVTAGTWGGPPVFGAPAGPNGAFCVCRETAEGEEGEKAKPAVCTGARAEADVGVGDVAVDILPAELGLGLCAGGLELAALLELAGVLSGLGGLLVGLLEMPLPLTCWPEAGPGMVSLGAPAVGVARGPPGMGIGEVLLPESDPVPLPEPV